MGEGSGSTGKGSGTAREVGRGVTAKQNACGAFAGVNPYWEPAGEGCETVEGGSRLLDHVGGALVGFATAGVGGPRSVGVVVSDAVRFC